MSQNNIPKAMNPLEVLSSRAKEGAGEVGAGIGLKANDAASLAPVVYDLFGRPADPTATPPVAAIVGKQPLCLEAKVVHTAARAARKAALAEGKKFVVKAMNNFKDELGTRWNARWEALGFVSGSLRLPSNPLPVLTLLGAHYRTHAEHEVAALNLTSAKAEQLRAAIVSTQTAADTARGAQKAAKLARDAAAERLRVQLGGLREELFTLLSDDDTRWYRFGFRRPVDGQTPDLVQTLRLRLGAAGEVIAEWTKARLAENYRVTWRVTGSTAEPTQVGLFSDPQTVITGLPHGASVTVIVTARNGAGESAPMEAVIAVP